MIRNFLIWPATMMRKMNKRIKIPMIKRKIFLWMIYYFYQINLLVILYNLDKINNYDRFNFGRNN